MASAVEAEAPDRIVEFNVGQPYEIPEDVPLLGEDEDIEPNCQVWRILCKRTGDKRVKWKKWVIGEINRAKERFVDFVKQGLIPFRVGTDGKMSAEVMREFDPAAEEVVFVPRRAVTKG